MPLLQWNGFYKMPLTRRQLLAQFPHASEEFLRENAVECCSAPIPKPKRALEAVLAQEMPTQKSIRFTIPLAMMGKPRMTHRDKWKKRPCVVRYRDWMDAARPFIPANLPTSPSGLSWTAYFPFPKSYSKKKRAELSGKPHQEKPDRDNCDKGLLDFLFTQDKSVAFGTIRKLWDDGSGARIEIEVIL